MSYNALLDTSLGYVPVNGGNHKISNLFYKNILCRSKF